jgi:hypothetical protein
MKINIWSILHTWRWPCRPKHVVRQWKPNTIKLARRWKRNLKCPLNNTVQQDAKIQYYELSQLDYILVSVRHLISVRTSSIMTEVFHSFSKFLQRQGRTAQRQSLVSRTLFLNKSRRMKMSKNSMTVLIYHRHKQISLSPSSRMLG